MFSVVPFISVKFARFDLASNDSSCRANDKVGSAGRSEDSVSIERTSLTRDTSPSVIQRRDNVSRHLLGILSASSRQSLGSLSAAS